jgi:putative flippase GtrA
MMKNGEVVTEVEPELAGAAPDDTDSGGSNRMSPERGRRGSSQLGSTLGSTMTRIFPSGGDGKGSYLGSIASSRLIKFLAVGGLGVFVNLLVMAVVFKVTGYRDWRASAIASTVAALHNYFLNNHWTFADRRRSGSALFSGALLYLPMSAAGVAITTVTYSILTLARFRVHFGTSSLYPYAVQLIAISFGTYLNYSLNKLFTWRSDDGVERLKD